MKRDFRGLLILTFWIVLMASGIWASATDLGVSPMRCVGSSVDEGDGLLNGKTGRAIARVQVEREPRRTDHRSDVLETDLTLGTIATDSPFLCRKRTRGTINVRHRLADGL